MHLKLVKQNSLSLGYVCSANQYCITKHKKLSTFLPCFASCSSQSAEAFNSRSLAGQWKHFIVFILLYYILPDIKCIEVTSWNSKVKISSFRTCKKWTKISKCSCYEVYKGCWHRYSATLHSAAAALIASV